ncbi:hypothetical protein Sulku_1401 [Sulfuricurvum kujiense DSM 16994]|uniref:Uncharacterized protein n=1 Tax=Sulfuricurvum kujiense (strain ATCC BAA-921 / DSM 16994 / JCM 11577 / YK-1) TaxID=709032 RepID=E4TYS2_SULKY|nr:hypothetical protein [Sulfuricurvum kujiense]ADR34063.1 hypothetical protein Sulku_1401 [Sulfuricurvum kujiense DSM 16994]
MDLKQKLVDFGCGNEFVEIALGYKEFYNTDEDIEIFIEYVEVEHAKVEEAEALKEREKEIVDAAGLLLEFEDEKEN